MTPMEREAYRRLCHSTLRDATIEQLEENHILCAHTIEEMKIEISVSRQLRNILVAAQASAPQPLPPEVLASNGLSREFHCLECKSIWLGVHDGVCPVCGPAEIDPSPEQEHDIGGEGVVPSLGRRVSRRSLTEFDRRDLRAYMQIDPADEEADTNEETPAEDTRPDCTCTIQQINTGGCICGGK